MQIKHIGPFPINKLPIDVNKAELDCCTIIVRGLDKTNIMANGDGALFLVKEIFRPWEAILDAVFYLGASYGTYKISRALLSAVKGVHTYLVPVGRAMSNSTDLSQRFGSWAGEHRKYCIASSYQQFLYSRNRSEIFAR